MPSRREDALGAWRSHLRSERHASPHTIRAYLSDVRQLLAFAGGGHETVDAGTIRHWLRALDGEAERSSIARKLAAVRAFFRFLIETKRARRDPAAAVATPKAVRKLPAHLTLDDVDRLLVTPDAGTWRGLRDRAMLELLYSSGLRVSELVGLDWDHVDEDGGSVRVLGKGR